MKKKAVSGILLTVLLMCMSTLAFNIPLVSTILPVHNINTGENFSKIQEAIDDQDTLNGHSILVDSGIYFEQLTVHKSISLIGEDKHTTIIDANGTGTVVSVTANNTALRGFTIRNGAMTGDQSGIRTFHSSGNKIFDNIIIHNKHGILLSRSSNNIISGNTISDNWGDSIWLYYSQKNNIFNNEIVNSFVGIFVAASSNNNIFENLIANIDGYHSAGIALGAESSSNNIYRNNVINNYYFGMFIYSECNNNNVYENNLVNNQYGIWLYTSSDNVFYHNNFVKNWKQVYDDSWPRPPSINIWDNGIPSGGNYWSDYEGVDADRDGIEDTPYIIDEFNQDNYPLVHPWCSSIGQIYSLVRDIRAMGLDERVEDRLVGLLEDAVEFLEEDLKLLATITMFRFIFRVRLYGWFGVLAEEQVSHLTTKARETIRLVWE